MTLGVCAAERSTHPTVDPHFLYRTHSYPALILSKG